MSQALEAGAGGSLTAAEQLVQFGRPAVVQLGAACRVAQGCLHLAQPADLPVQALQQLSAGRLLRAALSRRRQLLQQHPRTPRWQ